MLMRDAIDRHGFANFRELHRWSIDNAEDFWAEAWDDLGIIGERGVRKSSGDGFENTSWFPDARLNIVDTLLAGDPSSEVLVSYVEDSPRRSLTREQLREEVAACAAALRNSGVRAGDRVAAWTPNVIETVICALGALTIGAVVSTASTDFGPTALVDRFGQIEPTFLLAAASSRYGGKQFQLGESIAQVVDALPTLTTVVVIGPSDSHLTWEEWLAPHRGSELTTTSLPFDHPGFILFSSGTTGRPKCIVHSAAGVLLKVLSEQGYHLDVRPEDTMLYATTCGWMMWNWLLCGLGRGSRIVLCDGSPGYPDIDRLWTIAEAEGLAFLGVSAALIDTWRRAGITPSRDHAISALRTIASTGSPLAPSGYDWVAESVSPDVVVASIAGGTDLCGCLVLGVDTEPVVRGEIQGPALGLDVTVFRSDGTEADVGEEGELVCRTPFPTVPLTFWGDTDGSRRHSAYFDRFPGVWAHGDYARRTTSGGFEILGRLDATLNVKGVRIGTAEIYRVVLSLPHVVEAMAIEQPYRNDTRIVLFVVLDKPFDDELDDLIRTTLRRQASPRHVPEVIVQVPELPRTRSGKMTELAVADIVTGRIERDTSSLANPECLDWFRAWAAESTLT
jgi:acetoacetyl-CoA synthetase